MNRTFTVKTMPSFVHIWYVDLLWKKDDVGMQQQIVGTIPIGSHKSAWCY